MDGEHKVVSADGTPIVAWRTGTGPPLVLVHGTPADHTTFRFVAPLLEDSFTLYAIDRRGRGASGDTDPYSIRREFEDVTATVDSIDGPVGLFGHSYGADCALYAALATANVTKLILYEPSIGMWPGEPAAVDKLEAMIEAGDRDAALRVVFADVGFSAEEIDQLASAPTWPARVAAAHTVPREMRAETEVPFDEAKVATLTIPVLLLLGSETDDTYKKASERLEAALPDARIAILDGHGHAATMTAPELVAQRVTEFLT